MVLTNKSKVMPLVFFSLILALSFALSVSAVYNWYGNVTIGTNTSTNGAIIGAYQDSTSFVASTKTVRVGESGPAGSYQVDAGCNAGDMVFLKIWGINASVVTCNLGPANGNSTNLSISLVAADGACTYTSACDSNYKCCSGTTEVNDGTTSGATCESTCAAASSSSSSSGGGSSSGSSGGGGTASLGSETSTAVSITGPQTTSLPFTKSEDIAVTNVELSTTSTAAITNGKIAVKETTVGESISSGIASGSTKVYKYLSITKQNIKDSDLSKAKVTFEVPASWINENNIDLDSIKLNRYVSNEWVALPTKRMASSSSDKYLFEAETSGFSIFAVSGKASEKLTAFQLIDIIRDFYAGKSTYTAFDVIDKIRAFYA